MAHAQQVTFLRTNVKNQPGILLSILQAIKNKNISLKSLWGFNKPNGDAELYVIAKDSDKIKSLWEASGLLVQEGTAFFMKGTDKSGALMKNLLAIANANINIKAIHGIAVSGKYGSLLWVDDADVANAAKALGVK